MKPKQISKEEWMQFCISLESKGTMMEAMIAKRVGEDNLTQCPIVEDGEVDYPNNPYVYMPVDDEYEGSEWTGAKQGSQPTKEEVMQSEIDRLGRKIKKLELELSEVKFERAMLTCELNARGK